MTSLPIDLKAIAADHYRISLDESTRLDGSRESKAWCTHPAKCGHIGVYSSRELSAYCHARRSFSRLAASLPSGLSSAATPRPALYSIHGTSDAVAELLRARNGADRRDDGAARHRWLPVDSHGTEGQQRL